MGICLLADHVRPCNVLTSSSVRYILQDVECVIHGDLSIFRLLTSLGLGINVAYIECQLLQQFVRTVSEGYSLAGCAGRIVLQGIECIVHVNIAVQLSVTLHCNCNSGLVFQSGLVSIANVVDVNCALVVRSSVNICRSLQEAKVACIQILGGAILQGSNSRYDQLRSIEGLFIREVYALANLNRDALDILHRDDVGRSSGCSLASAGSGGSLTAAGSGGSLTAAGSGGSFASAGGGGSFASAGSGCGLTAARSSCGSGGIGIRCCGSGGFLILQLVCYRTGYIEGNGTGCCESNFNFLYGVERYEFLIRILLCNVSLDSVLLSVRNLECQVICAIGCASLEVCALVQNSGNVSSRDAQLYVCIALGQNVVYCADALVEVAAVCSNQTVNGLRLACSRLEAVLCSEINDCSNHCIGICIRSFLEGLAAIALVSSV